MLLLPRAVLLHPARNRKESLQGHGHPVRAGREHKVRIAQARGIQRIERRAYIINRRHLKDRRIEHAHYNQIVSQHVERGLENGIARGGRGQSVYPVRACLLYVVQQIRLLFQVLDVIGSQLLETFSSVSNSLITP